MGRRPRGRDHSRCALFEEYVFFGHPEMAKRNGWNDLGVPWAGLSIRIASEEREAGGLALWQTIRLL